MDTFVSLKFLAQLALPPASLAIGLVVAGVLVLVGLRRLARLVVVLAIAELLVLSFPPISHLLMSWLQDGTRVAAKAAPACCYDAIVVLGGGEMTEADAMRLFLTDLGVPKEAIVIEGASINTIENIRYVRKLVKDGRVALVTSASHMPRALRLARTAGLNVEAFPTDWGAPLETRGTLDYWIPSLGALSVSSIALLEILANTFDRRGESLAP
jgi:uncharacterized SAM-binding protein YcdF (DUF218 family)